MSFSKRLYEQQAENDSPTRRLEQARAQLRRAIADVQATEGRFLDYETADAIQRTLAAAARNLKELTITLAVMERTAA
jgi:hypothetical protein